jgi:hypothetical protein
MNDIEKSTRLAVEIAEDEGPDWSKVDGGDWIVVIAKGQTAYEFRSVLENFEARVAPHPQPVRPVRVRDGVRDTQSL